MPLIWEGLYFRGEDRLLRKALSACCCCFCKPPGEEYILENVNGIIGQGNVVALMGPSGSGKSTIFKCLTIGKVHRGYCKGTIKVQRPGVIVYGGNGSTRTAAAPAVASYICQNDQDHLLFTLTVEESLMYSSQLKNPSGVNHEAIITEQVEQLGLARVRGNKVSKLSGGEKKRLVVGLELTSDPKPNYLFLDEPTSGLDSLAVLELLDTLSKLVAGKPMAVITVIHQPSYEALLKFNQVFFLSRAGNLIYGGAPGSQLLRYITDHGYYRATNSGSAAGAGTENQNENPADIMIKIASSVARTKKGHRRDDVESQHQEPTPLQQICTTMAKTYQRSYESAMQNAASAAQHQQLELVEIQEDGLCKNGSHFSLKNLWVLLRRTARATILGQSQFLLIRFALHAVVALTLALLYNRQIGTEDACYTTDPRFDARNCSCARHEEELLEESVAAQNVKFQFFSLLFLMFAAIMPTVLSYPAEIKVFLNEHRNGWYTTATYYTAKTLTEIPFQTLFPYFYIWALYWYTQQIGMGTWSEGILGLNTWRYGQFLGISLLACFTAQGLGFLIGILCVHSSNIAIILSSSVLLFLFLFSGFFVKSAEMGASVQWLTYFSFIKFAFEGLIILIYGFDRCGLIPPPGSTIPSVPTKSAILYTFNIHDEDLAPNFYWLLAHFVVIRVLAFVLLKNRGDPKFLRPSRILRESINWLADVCSKVSKGWSKLCDCGRFGPCCGLLIRIWCVLFAVQIVVGAITGIINATK